MVTKPSPNLERRSGRSHQAILRAAGDLFRERGYSALTMEGIAAHAGVGKQTIYRWWPSKGAVVLDAVQQTIVEQIGFPDLGDALAEIRQWQRSVAAVLASPEVGPQLAALVGAQQSDPALAQAFHERIFVPTRDVLRARIERAQQAGQIRRVDPDVVADLLMGPVWFRLLVSREPALPRRVDAMIDALLDGLRP